MNQTKRISIIVPAYNEEENIRPLYDRVLPVLKGLGPDYDYEFIFVDDHSQDNTPAELEKLAAEDSRVRVFRFSRNFGFQQAVYTGFIKATGDAAIELDCDLQDPPELIPAFIEKWNEGYHVVYGKRVVRKESFFINQARHVAYWLINFLSEDDLPLDAGDFRLVDRRLIDELKQMVDCQPYLRGAVAALGFKQVGIPYERAARELGESKFPMSKLIQLGLDGILNHSVVPLRLATYLGLTLSIVMFLGFIIYFLGRLFFGEDWPQGFATTTTLQLLSISVTSLFLGIIGEYLGRIYRQVKRRPHVVIEKTWND